VIDNPQRIQSAGLNHAIRAARGDVIARMDVHADYAPNYLEKCVEVLGRTGADNVGGAARGRAKGPVQRAVCAALHSRLGFGGAAFRDAQAEGYVDTLFPGAFRRGIFDKVGLFDEGAVTNEDAELNQRILQAGGRIYLSREIEVYYYPRDSLTGLARQYFRYGQGRARTLLKHRRFARPRPAVPFLALVLAIGAAIVFPRAVALAAAAYVLTVSIETVRLAPRFAAPLAATWLAFPIMHLCHGAGFGVGLVRFLLRPNWPRA
jgi:GT2 family glycosyltransferase